MVEYRRAVETDLAGEYAVFASAQQELHNRRGAAWSAPPFDSDGPWAQVHRHLLAHNGERSHVAEDDGRIIGFTAALVRGDCWYFSALFIDPAYRGQGIGQRLLGLARAALAVCATTAALALPHQHPGPPTGFTRRPAARRAWPDPADGRRDLARLQPDHLHRANHPPPPALVLVAARAPGPGPLAPPGVPLRRRTLPAPKDSRNRRRAGKADVVEPARTRKPSDHITVRPTPEWLTRLQQAGVDLMAYNGTRASDAAGPLAQAAQRIQGDPGIPIPSTPLATPNRWRRGRTPPMGRREMRPAAQRHLQSPDPGRSQHSLTSDTHQHTRASPPRRRRAPEAFIWSRSRRVGDWRGFR